MKYSCYKNSYDYIIILLVVYLKKIIRINYNIIIVWNLKEWIMVGICWVLIVLIFFFKSIYNYKN